MIFFWLQKEMTDFQLDFRRSGLIIWGKTGLLSMSNIDNIRQCQSVVITCENGLFVAGLVCSCWQWNYLEREAGQWCREKRICPSAGAAAVWQRQKGSLMLMSQSETPNPPTSQLLLCSWPCCKWTDSFIFRDQYTFQGKKQCGNQVLYSKHTVF